MPKMPHAMGQHERFSLRLAELGVRLSFTALPIARLMLIGLFLSHD